MSWAADDIKTTRQQGFTKTHIEITGTKNLLKVWNYCDSDTKDADAVENCWRGEKMV